MIIRRLNPVDWDAYRTIRLEALQLAPEAFGSDYAEASGRTPEDWAAGLSLPDTIVLGAFTEGSIVGMAGLSRERRVKTRHKATVFGVYVSPAVRGAGCAKALVTELIRLAQAMGGVEQLMLCVVAENAAAIAVYAGLGFRIYGREPRALKLGGRYLDEELMVLALGPSTPVT
ncbi:MAG TPA: GNAT family N-acetyltransferase [Symbiobacteriaceae bacterium]|nr:GNAT family N-acetyltransferase [Symbiobacteriaceae bacterium]